MTKRKPVSSTQPIWSDGQRVDQQDLKVEQAHNSQTASAIIANHLGSGVLLESVSQVILFDSSKLSSSQTALLAAGNFDGTGLTPALQPSDINLGNQLEIELIDSLAAGRKSVKVAIIGLAFDNTLQVDRLYFYRNEKQVTSKHYKKILSILTNDFKGNQHCSNTLGGKLVIREAESFQLSRDAKMVAQDIEPDVFWRDFKFANISLQLKQVLQTAIGAEYSVDALDINTTGIPSRTLEASDITSQVGQKFKATTNNIQKITLLLGVSANGTSASRHNWTGDLVVSLYELQSTVHCESDIVPELNIDFDPSNEPLVQLTFNQNSLLQYGHVLTDVLQPVDFVFNTTKIGSTSNPVIEVGKYYAVTVKRSGSATAGQILLGAGNNKLEDSRLTLFGGVWVDVSEQDLWFQVWTAAGKLADGQGYDNGNGIQIDKTVFDSKTGVEVDNQYGQVSLVDTGINILNTAILQAITEESIKLQDEQSGNKINTRQKYEATLSFVTNTGLEDLKKISDPLIVGSMQDTNPKLNPTISGTTTLTGLAKGDEFIIINPNADLLNNNLLGSRLIPNTNNASVVYKIAKITYCTHLYGDVDGDGKITTADLNRASQLIGKSLTSASTQADILSGDVSVLEMLRADVNADGSITSVDINSLTSYINKKTVSFTAGTSFTTLTLKVEPAVGRYDGYFDCNTYVSLSGPNSSNIILRSAVSPSDALLYGNLVPVSLSSDAAFTTIPFVTVPFRIDPVSFWQPYLLAVSSKSRQVPAIFTYDEAIVPNDCTTNDVLCTDRNKVEPAHNPGRNDYFVPDNLVIGNGDILRKDGSFYKNDVEIATVVLNLPATPLQEVSLNVFNLFVSDRGDGKTIAEYPAMCYADCSRVQPADLALNKVKFGVAIQAVHKNIDGYSMTDGYVAIIDNTVGISINQTTGLLSLNITNLAVDLLYTTLISKIQIQVFLKKAGWNNSVLAISADELQGLIS